MTILNPINSLINVTKAMEGHDKFAYVNIPKSAIISLSKNSSESLPSVMAKNVLSSIRMHGPNVMKAISHTLVTDVESGRHQKIGLAKDHTYYHSNVFEYYFLNNKDVFSTTVDYFVKNTPTVVVTFHDKKLIQKTLGSKTNVITVSYSNHYSKFDDVFAQVAEFEGGVDYCVFDCGILGLALTSKVYDKLNMSTIDLGKTISLMKSNLVAKAA